MRKLTINTDGACAGNPGPMGIGIVVRDVDANAIIEQHSSMIGVGTNNFAEYSAVITALEIISCYSDISQATICSDSQLVIRQINGIYEIKQDTLIKLNKQVHNVLKVIPYPVKFEWVPRDENPIADALASQAIKMPQAKMDKDGNVVLWSSVEHGVGSVSEYEELPEPKCWAGIMALYAKATEAKFSDMIALKPGGTDSYSKMSEETLINAINIRFGKEACQWLIDALDVADDGYKQNALRWAARGLRPDMALKKAAVDIEVEANRKSKRVSHAG